MAVDYLRPFLSHSSMLDIKEEGQSDESKTQKGTVLHSGHFMISRVHEPNNDDDEEEAVVVPFNDDNAFRGYDFVNAAKQTSTTYDFGNAAIDESLTKLFECMTLAYSGTITSPRWKQFRGLHVSQKQRIRLNNLIWREWHMQYIYQKQPMVCQFATPLSDDIHSKPEAVVLEGKYWKRRLDTVTAEYKKWRRYYKDQAQRLRWLQGSGSSTWYHTNNLSEWELLERVKDVTYIPCLGSGVKGEGGVTITQGQSNTDLALLQTDMMEMDFSNDLFNSLNSAPFPFPNPRELNQLGRSDLIQPGLLQLQPNLEEFMDIDSWQEMLRIPTSFGSSLNQSMGSSSLADTSNNFEMSQGGDTLLDFLTNVPGGQAQGSNSGGGQVAGQISLAVTPSSPVLQQQSQLLPQAMSPLTQLMVANTDSTSVPNQQQNVTFQQPMTSADNHNGNGGQQQPGPQFQLHANSTLLVGSPVDATPTQGYTLVTSGGMNTNLNNSNMNLSVLNTPTHKVISDNNSSSSVSADIVLQMLQQEAQKRQLQQQQQQQQRQQLLQQQQQQRMQQQRLHQQRQQQQRPKAPSLAPKSPAQHPIQPQQQLLQQILQQHQQQQQQQQQHFQQSPSAQSPLLAQSLTISPSTAPQRNSVVFGVENTSALRTKSQATSALSSSPSQAPLPQPSVTPSRKGGRQARASNKQQSSASARRDSGGGVGSGGGASGVMSDLAKIVASKKKDGPFTVPQAKPVNVPRKNRTIAPAPVPIAPYVPPIPAQQSSASSTVSNSSSQESYLAKLLKNGTYTGARINVKKETSLQQSQHHPLTGVAQTSPIQTTTNLYQQLQAAPASSPPTGILGQITAQRGSDLVTLSTGNQVQTSLPMLTGASLSGLDLGSLTQQSLANVVLPLSLRSQLEAVSTSQGLGDNQPQASGFSQGGEEKVSSVPSSPRTPGAASPPSFSVKPLPSPPQPSMDTSSSFGDPVSPFSMLEMSPSTLGDPSSPGSGDNDFMPDSRRAAHLSAEQKRRWNLKTGFDMLQQLVPSLSQNPRVSKATMLQKTAEFCKKLKAERLQMQKEATILKREIETLNTSISAVQAQLPETGVPMTRQRKDQMREMLDEYIRQRTKENWKFWIFSVIMNSLYDSYCSAVSTASMEELCKTSLAWLDQSCSLVTLRPKVLNALRKLCTTTSILTEPQKVKEQALQAVDKSPDKRK